MDIIIFFLIVISVIVALTWVFNHFCKITWVKYIFVAVFIIFGVISLMKAYEPSPGFKALGDFLLALINFIAAITVLITSILLDTLRKKKK